jgi:hypothetical protein
MAECFVEDVRGITYREPAAPATGLVIGLFGVVSLAVSVVFLTAITAWPLQGGNALGVLAVVVFAAFGCAAMALAIAAFRPQQVRFDRDAQRVRGRVRGRLWLHRSIDVDASALGRPVVQTSSHDEGPDLHEVRVPWPGHPSLVLGCYEDQATARHWQDRLALLMRG